MPGSPATSTTGASPAATWQAAARSSPSRVSRPTSGPGAMRGSVVHPARARLPALGRSPRHPDITTPGLTRRGPLSQYRILMRDRLGLRGISIRG